MNRQKLLKAAIFVAKNRISIPERVYVRYSNDETKNTRYWLTFGILSGGVRDWHATHLAQEITESLGNKKYRDEHKNILCYILSSPHGGASPWKYRFPNKRSSYLHHSLATLELHNNELPINKAWSQTKQRNQVLQLFKGIGIKQASLLLRNIKYNFDCCVIDTHIINFLKLLEMIPQNFGPTITTKKYLTIESLFLCLCKKNSIAPVLLDIAIWDIMRNKSKLPVQ